MAVIRSTAILMLLIPFSLSAMDDGAGPAEEQEPICSICISLLTNLHDRDNITIAIVCGHSFHSTCLDNYITQKRRNNPQISIRCPLCKQVIIQRDVQENIYRISCEKFRTIKVIE